jgi:hypothetical protein
VEAKLVREKRNRVSPRVFSALDQCCGNAPIRQL